MAAPDRTTGQGRRDHAVLLFLYNAEDQKRYADTRDAVAKTMTPKQLADAQRRANGWTVAFEKRTK